MKEDALQKGLPIPDEAAVRDRVLKKHVNAPPDLATVKDFLPLPCGHEQGEDQGENILRLAQHVLRSGSLPASAVLQILRQTTTTTVAKSTT